MAYTKLLYHIVLRTHQGTAPIVEAHEKNLYRFIHGFCKNHQCLLYRINGMPDHIHMFVSIPPFISVAAFVHDLKIATHNYIKANRDLFPSFVKWERGYCALSYAESQRKTVTNYIINQKNHHRRKSVRDELISQLREGGVEFDETYV
jgi:REP element-mobilizing transposase RayT